MNTTVYEVASVVDCESLHDCIRIDYAIETPGVPERPKTDWVYTRPRGNWRNIVFQKEDGMTLDEFLNTMVVKNTDVLRKMCVTLLKKIGYDYHKYLYLIPMIDPTFEPPRLNKSCRWQRELGEAMVNEFFLGVIMTCVNNRRLERLYHELVYIVEHKYK